MEKAKRPKITRILIIIGATLAVVLLVCRLTLPYIVKNIAERELNKQLGVNATIGSVSLSLFGGSATLREVAINNPSDLTPEPFFSAQKVFVDIALASLLSKEIRIELVEIQRLVLRVQRSKEGRLSFIPIPGPLKSTSPTPLEKPAEAQTEKSILLDLLKVEDAQISFEDYAVSEPPLLTELKGINVFLKSFRYPDTSSRTESEINIKGQLVATKTSPITIHSAFQLGKTPPLTIVSDSQEKLEDVYLPHFNPYVRSYGFIFTSGAGAITYTGKTAEGQIDGLANVRFDKVRLEETGLKVGPVVFGIPIQYLPRLFQDPKGTLELSLKVSGSVSDPQVSWSNLSEQLLAKALGAAFRAGLIPLRKPYNLITEGVTQSGKDGGELLHKLKDMLAPQTSTEEEKGEVKEGKQKGKLEELFKSKLMDQLKGLKKKEAEKTE